MYNTLFFLLLILNNIVYSQVIYAKPPVFVDSYQKSIEISEKLKHKLIIVFTASWCLPCQKLKKDISDNLEKFEDTTICFIDIENDKKISQQFKVSQIPYALFYDKNQLTKKIVGYSDINNFIK